MESYGNLTSLQSVLSVILRIVGPIGQQVHVGGESVVGFLDNYTSQGICGTMGICWMLV